MCAPWPEAPPGSAPWPAAPACSPPPPGSPGCRKLQKKDGKREGCKRICKTVDAASGQRSCSENRGRNGCGCAARPGQLSAVPSCRRQPHPSRLPPRLPAPHPTADAKEDISGVPREVTLAIVPITPAAPASFASTTWMGCCGGVRGGEGLRVGGARSACRIARNCLGGRTRLHAVCTHPLLLLNPAASCTPTAHNIVAEPLPNTVRKGGPPANHATLTTPGLHQPLPHAPGTSRAAAPALPALPPSARRPARPPPPPPWPPRAAAAAWRPPRRCG